MKQVLTWCVVLGLAIAAQGQEIVWEKFYRADPDTYHSIAAQAILKSDDDGYVIAGTYYDGVESRIFKIDDEGEVLWNYHHISRLPHTGQDLFKTSEGNYIYMTAEYINSHLSPALVCINDDGEELWSKVYFADGRVSFGTAVMTDDDQLVILGYNPDGRVWPRFTFVVNEDGDSLRYQEFGWPERRGRDSRLVSGTLIGQDRILFTGGVSDYDTEYYLTFFECDTQGDSVNFIQTDFGPYFLGKRVKPIGNGYLLVLGTEYTRAVDIGYYGDAFLAEFRDEGEVQWHESYGVVENSDGFADWSILPNGEIVLAGYRESLYPWLIMTNNHGEVLSELKPEGLGYGWLTCIARSSDNEIIVVGSSQAELFNSLEYYWVMKVALPNNVEEPLAEIPYEFKILSTFPNPFNSAVTIELLLKKSLNIQVLIHDVSGRKINQFPSQYYTSGKHRLLWSINNNFKIGSGLYYINFESTDYRTSVPVVLVK